MDLSIIIPAHNEVDKIAGDVRAAGAFLREHGLRGEVIVVDDGSEDATASRAESAGQGESGEHVEVRVLRFEENRGKGAAVRSGVLESRGQYVMFADSGECVPYEYAWRGLEILREGGCEIAHGSRKLAETRVVRRPRWHRRVASRMFRWFVGWFVGAPGHLTDTQVGFKLYRGEAARELYGACRSERFMFDMEIILRAGRRGYRICEFPIEWHSDRDTRFSFVRHSWMSFWDLVEMKRRLAREWREESATR